MYGYVDNYYADFYQGKATTALWFLGIGLLFTAFSAVLYRIASYDKEPFCAVLLIVGGIVTGMGYVGWSLAAHELVKLGAWSAWVYAPHVVVVAALATWLVWWVRQ